MRVGSTPGRDMNTIGRVVVSMGWHRLGSSALVGAALVFGMHKVQAQQPVGAVVVEPSTVVLRHHRQPQSLQVLGASAEGYSLDLRERAQITSADPKVAAVEAGWVRPIAS